VKVQKKQELLEPAGCWLNSTEKTFPLDVSTCEKRERVHAARPKPFFNFCEKREPKRPNAFLHVAFVLLEQ